MAFSSHVINWNSKSNFVPGHCGPDQNQPRLYSQSGGGCVWDLCWHCWAVTTAHIFVGTIRWNILPLRRGWVVAAGFSVPRELFSFWNLFRLILSKLLRALFPFQSKCSWRNKWAQNLETSESLFQGLISKALCGLREQFEVLVTDKDDIILELSEACVASLLKMSN